LDDEKLERIHRHFQKQINTLASFTGQALAVLAFEDPRKREALEHVTTHWDAIVSDDMSKTRLMNHLREAMDKMLTESRRQHPGVTADDDFLD
jgi:dephospho-CoA kinase